jgi:orotate phosphoribosyltransferase-like protein
MEEYNFCNWGYGWAVGDTALFQKMMNKGKDRFCKIASKHQFDAIAFTGCSGSAIAYILAMEYQVPLIYIRRENERSHGFRVEGTAGQGIYRYLIVDDFVSTGATVRRIIKEIKDWTAKKTLPEPECIGVLAYDGSGNSMNEVYIDGKVIRVFN